ncbi:MAG: hypothetical protein JNJ90_01475 [Saprospiraceae bacterium]|jgi:hypothetical protein|nr:hypothetical protein [Saprospiraceae bacterium]
MHTAEQFEHEEILAAAAASDNQDGDNVESTEENTEVSDDQEDGPEAEEIEEDITEDEVGVSDDEATEEA